MPQLREFLTLYRADFENLSNFAILLPEINPDERYSEYMTNYQFFMGMWDDIARETRGLNMPYDGFTEFWADFKPWWDVRKLEFLRILRTRQYYFNPVYNYDRYETVTETSESTGTEKTDGAQKQESKNSDFTTGNRTQKDSTTTIGNETSIEGVNGYNSPEGSFNDATRNTRENSASGTGESTSEDSTTSTGDSTATGSYNNSRETSGNVKNSRTVRAYGNVGVTTSQQMLEEERKLMQKHVVSYIAEDFKRDFCVLVY